MNNFKSKFLSVLLALVMVVGVLAPSVARAEGTAEATDVVIHKMLLKNLTGWPKPTNPDGTQQGITDDKKYDGNQITDIIGYFGEGATELAGVNFTYWKVTEDQYKTMMGATDSYKTVAQVDAYLTGSEKASKTVVGPTTKTGLEVTGLADGWYWFVENTDANIEGGATISGYAAVPFGLQLPVWKADGSRFGTRENALHVYPKNTTSEKPDVEKKIEGHEQETNPVDLTVGSEVPYIITTTIKTGTKYQTAKWSDQMTEGLTFGQDQLNAMEITIGGAPADTKDYEKKLVGNGFEVKLTPQGLEKINGKDANTEITIKYKAILNEKALVEIPESNDVTFNYGNNPDHGNTPVPTKPNPKGELKVTKTWADSNVGNLTPPEGTKVTLTLYNAQTGEVVKVAEPKKNPVTLDGTNGWTYTWTGLDKDTEYKVVETAIEGYSAEYGKVGDNGEISLKNWKDGNPPPVTPEEPKVVTGGKRFQKVDPKLEEGKQGLSGAEFLVKNADGKWLKAKGDAQLAADQKAYQTAEKAYQDAVKAGTSTEDELKALKKTRDDAYRNVKTTWEWIDADNKEAADTAGAYKVTSGEDGYFKVTGLAYGKYKLVEFKAPEGYALLTEEIPFTVAKGSLENTEGIIQKVENKKITIPQTGGIGTILFTLVGAGLMGSAVFAMKRREREEEEDEE